MATFKVGQRVRSLPGTKLDWIDTGTVHYVDPTDSVHPYQVRTDHAHCANDDLLWWHRACELAPLTDPKADAFIESLKRLEREPLNVAPKVAA